MTEDERYRNAFKDTAHNLQRGRERAREREALRLSLDEMAVDASSAGGAVTVSVNWQGMLTGLKLGPEVHAMSSTQFADVLLQTYTAAQQDAARKAATMAQISPATATLADAVHWRMSFEPSIQRTTLDPSQPDHGQRVSGSEAADRKGGASFVSHDDHHDDDYFGNLGQLRG